MTEGRPLVTIAIPTYNRADSFLTRALNSALNQTYPNLEIIVSDNCSVDHTRSLVEGFSDPRIKYFRQSTNIGANDNFNFCVEQSRGLYFLLLSDDDEIDRDFIEVCMDAVAHAPHVGIIQTGTRVVDGQGTVIKSKRNRVAGLDMTGFILGWFAGETSLYLCSTLFNTARLKGIGGFHSKTNLFQDVVAEIKLAAEYGREDISAVKASFRRHDNNQGSMARLNDWVQDSLYLLDVMCEAVPESDKEVVRREGLAYLCRKNYRYVAALPSLAQRVETYYSVYKRFGYTYSPLRYTYDVVLGDMKHRISRAAIGARKLFGRGASETKRTSLGGPEDLAE